MIATEDVYDVIDTLVAKTIDRVTQERGQDAICALRGKFKEDLLGNPIPATPVISVFGTSFQAVHYARDNDLLPELKVAGFSILTPSIVDCSLTEEQSKNTAFCVIFNNAEDYESTMCYKEDELWDLEVIVKDLVNWMLKGKLPEPTE